MEQSGKKKRWRPSLTAYRALENELEELKENNRLLRLENKYNSEEIEGLKRNLSDAVVGIYGKDVIKENMELKKELDEQIEGTSRLVADCNGWRDKYHELKDKNRMLEYSNDHMEKEMKRRSALKDDSQKKIEDLQREVEFLKNRSFWQRVFNVL